MRVRTHFFRAWVVTIFIILLACIATGTFWYWMHSRKIWQAPLKVGIIHSLTGTMAISEKSMVDILLMAFEELNAEGGLLGKTIQPIVVDGKSDEKVFALEAERLITQEGVQALFGCWTSASRKHVLPVLEKYKHLLFYAVQYEGLEESPYIIYLGATPNQTIIPGTTWCFKNLGKKFFLIGSDYIYPRVVHKLLGLHIASLGGEVVGEAFVKLGGQVSAELIKTIADSQATVLLNSVNGESNISLFKELRKAQITSEKLPVMSFSISEPELAVLDIESIMGSYGAWTYFQSLNTSANKSFVKKVQAKYGATQKISDNMISAYSSVKIWALAAIKAGSAAPAAVLSAIQRVEYNGPGGVVFVDANHHCWWQTCIGRIEYNAQFSTIWSSGREIRALVYPPYLTKQDWNTFIFELYDKWGRQWSAE